MGQHPKGRRDRRAVEKKHRSKEFSNAPTRQKRLKDSPSPRHRDINEQIDAFGLLGEEIVR